MQYKRKLVSTLYLGFELLAILISLNLIISYRLSISEDIFLLIAAMFIGIFGLKFDTFHAKKWITKKFQHPFLNFWNYILQIISWVIISNMLVNKGYSQYSLFSTLPIILIILCVVSRILTFKFSSNKIFCYFQMIIIFLVVGGIAKGIPTGLIYAFSNTNSVKSFTASALISIPFVILMVKKLMETNNIRKIQTSDSLKSVFAGRAWFIIILVHIVALFFDSGFWLHPLSTWHLTTEGLMFGLYAGFVEEMLARGLILGILINFYANETNGLLKAIIYQSLIFGIVHLSGIISGEGISAIFVALDVTAMGIVWGLIYLYTQRIWIVIVMHMAWDILENIISQESNLSIPGFQGIIVSVLVSLIFLSLSIFLFRKKTINLSNVNKKTNTTFIISLENKNEK
ncbi:CPBP family intramembrane glutamic endopeptidase [Leuconostoc suionicum]|uniref:CPBP family intramembrane glutamic endopeptidase n=1 Tax=Leuconostoc suionicum TaxID=1511761 RepID=UPI0032DF9BCF